MSRLVLDSDSLAGLLAQFQISNVSLDGGKLSFSKSSTQVVINRIDLGAEVRVNGLTVNLQSLAVNGDGVVLEFSVR